MTETGLCVLITVVATCGFVVGRMWRATADREVMDADANELAALRETVREQGEELARLKEEGGDYDWINESILLAEKVSA